MICWMTLSHLRSFLGTIAPVALVKTQPRKLWISSVRRILVLQLKRFQGLQKIEDFVRFPSKLRLNFVSVGNGEHQLYLPTGVVCHSGRRIANGHYICYVLAGDKWLKADDRIVQEVRYETVKRKQVYVLFYQRL